MKKSFIKVLFLFAALIDTCFAPVFKQQYGSSRIKTPYGEMRGLLIEFPRHSKLQYVEGYLDYTMLQYSLCHFDSLCQTLRRNAGISLGILRILMALCVLSQKSEQNV